MLNLDIRILLLHVAAVMDMFASIISSNPAKLLNLTPASKTKKPIKRHPSMRFAGDQAPKSFNQWALLYWLPTLMAIFFNLLQRQASNYGMVLKLIIKSLPWTTQTMGVTLRLLEEIMLLEFTISKLKKLPMHSKENSGINPVTVIVFSQLNLNLKTL